MAATPQVKRSVESIPSCTMATSKIVNGVVELLDPHFGRIHQRLDAMTSASTPSKHASMISDD